MTQMDNETATIDGETYRVRHIDPLTATDITVDLAKMFAPVFAALGGSILGAKDTKKQISEILDGGGSADGEGLPSGTPVAIERALNGFFQNLSKEEVRFLIATMRPVTEVKKGNNWPELDSIFEVHFRGKPASIFKWLAFAMRVNFKGFFSAFASAINRAAQQLGQGQ